jgi:hypothetical protein
VYNYTALQHNMGRDEGGLKITMEWVRRRDQY